MDVGQINVQRQNGVALWRQIADRIRASIANGEYDATGMVPPEMVLAAQFGVNRHTVRSALAALAQEGIVRAMQGRGTLIERKERLNFPISQRTRFTEGIGDQARKKEGLLLSSAEEPASAALAASLRIAEGAPVIRLETLRKADRRPVSRSTNWFPAGRFAGMKEAYEASGSITAAFQALGLSDYWRFSTEITATHADGADLADLQLSPGAIILVARALNVDPDGVPVQYAVSRFPADMVQFTIAN
ncbi:MULTISPECIES: phosphonate metabolism transcriptional regulator PhnF [Rhizobium/Agrobacterium group]|uniref:Phosphonate metabolism transcriptional regulator PhnF n=2 Tax=Neorhizobium TaxID=1525371 RepID=A0ABV0M9L2_9HYPH|nr:MULTISPECIES: phosphonate metabolism transcriptional regulator PhnF [Rhizobium/Agrobacterium group]KGD98143.1 transcriptional regulator [Rhizobium sp. YS-1r]MCC2613247.1 phosphonate metabolism transcriptional regulator PhnF [Neorhizobium petrolearium]WGI68337.1 phosphonate metabolism transcriptional regulator PhnF [Neorhizobium petrolearium]